MTADLAAQVLRGDRRALARLITQLERDSEAGRAALAALWPHTGRAHVVGVTGPSGSGKSTLVNAIAKQVRAAEQGGPARTVGVVAVDPTSPFSGGAILGDRIRMRDLAGDPGIFIRSMATRGRLGGLARATADTVRALDAAGFDLVLVETVGAGQAEVDIARAAHTVIVVEAPGLGDDVQANKAGILEIADILVVNKADRPGADETARALRVMLELGDRAARTGGWQTPICRAVATTGEGVPEIVQAVERHRALLQQGGLAERERERVRQEMLALLGETLLQRLLAGLADGQFAAAVERVAQRAADPRQEVERLAAAAGLHSERESNRP